VTETHYLTEREANAVWSVLVTEAGASSDADDRREFVYHQTTEFVSEFRFMGSLGFGGKFWRGRRDERWYVTCYPEHMTPDRRQIVADTNAALAELHASLKTNH
jgi:hypothetical protein